MSIDFLIKCIAQLHAMLCEENCIVNMVNGNSYTKDVHVVYKTHFCTITISYNRNILKKNPK